MNSTVLAITGSGLKTLAAVTGRFEDNGAIRPRLAEFKEKFLNLAPRQCMMRNGRQAKPG